MTAIVSDPGVETNKVAPLSYRDHAKLTIEGKLFIPTSCCRFKERMKKLSDTIHRTGGHWVDRCWVSGVKSKPMPQSNPNFTASSQTLWGNTSKIRTANLVVERLNDRTN